MYINDVHRKEEIQNIAIQDLKHLGIKYRSKKIRHNVQITKNRKVFKKPLHALPVETVTLPNGLQLMVPKIVHELCSFIEKEIDTEGLFRKGGSKSRQNQIKLSLDAGCMLGDEHHVIDVASVLKTFFRELPQPLIPFHYHEIFLRAILLNSKQKEAVLLCCLLLPAEHLNTLKYFLEFLQNVTKYMNHNKMDSYNLAVVIGPTVLPAEEKLQQNAQDRLSKTCELFKLLIEHAGEIGVLSENILDRIAGDSSIHNSAKKKKRRSGSLTRMFSGLKKIVSHKNSEEDVDMMPDLLSTPCLTRSAKKRKVDAAGLSTKKRREIIDTLPNKAIFNTFLPSRPDFSAESRVKKSPAASTKTAKSLQKEQAASKEKRPLWVSRSKSSISRLSLDSASMQRRLSAVSSATFNKKKKRRTSCLGVVPAPPESTIEPIVEQNLSAEKSPDYVKISKAEYEEIKNRVSEIERRISIELEQAPSELPGGVGDVELAYKQTLNEAEPLSPTTDQLARRLSKELKIRRSTENRVIRSPSARKIGTLRRRSRDLQQQARLSNTSQTWCVANSSSESRASLRRGKPNTVMSGLPQPSPQKSTNSITNSENLYENITDLTRSNSLHHQSDNSSNNSWKSARCFFTSGDSSLENTETARASLTKLRSQNAGMVMQKAKLFDNLTTSATKNDNNRLVIASTSQQQKHNKIGAVRNDARMQSRVKTLRVEDRRISKKSMSPRRRNCKSPRHQRVHANITERAILKELNKGELSPHTPRITPHIRRQLNTKSPRRLSRNSQTKDLRTPMRVPRLPTTKMHDNLEV